MAKAWFPFYMNDYAADTVLLDLAEHGAYILLMSFYWNQEGEVYANAEQMQSKCSASASVLHKVCRCTTDAERNAVDSVAAQYFPIIDGKYTNARLDKELAKSASISASRAKAAKAKHGKTSASAGASAGASAEQVHTQSQSQSQSQDKDFKDKFESIWEAYPNKSGKKSAERHFNASVKTEQDLSDIFQALYNYRNHLALPQNSYKQYQNGSTWFNNWRDWLNWEEPEARTEQKPEAKQSKTMKAVKALMKGIDDGSRMADEESDVSSRAIDITPSRLLPQ